MNKDQITGTIKETVGKVQQKTGELIDSPEQQAKGLVKQAEGWPSKKWTMPKKRRKRPLMR